MDLRTPALRTLFCEILFGVSQRTNMIEYLDKSISILVLVKVERRDPAKTGRSGEKSLTGSVG